MVTSKRGRKSSFWESQQWAFTKQKQQIKQWKEGSRVPWEEILKFKVLCGSASKVQAKEERGAKEGRGQFSRLWDNSHRKQCNMRRWWDVPWVMIVFHLS